MKMCLWFSSFYAGRRAEWILVGASQGYERASKAGIKYMVSVVENQDGIADFVTRIQGWTND